jgi:hypothetical protein
MAAPLVRAEEPEVKAESQGPMIKEEGKGHGMHGMKGKSKEKGMMGKGMMGGGMCSMMSGKQMVAVGDGIVVLSGNKLIKYDKNLNVVKEVEIKADKEGMDGGCPMMKMMGGEGEGAGAPADVTPGEEKGDHEAHH